MSQNAGHDDKKKRYKRDIMLFMLSLTRLTFVAEMTDAKDFTILSRHQTHGHVYHTGI